jgi:isoleucyl-tRNA synthetase
MYRFSNCWKAASVVRGVRMSRYSTNCRGAQQLHNAHTTHARLCTHSVQSHTHTPRMAFSDNTKKRPSFNVNLPQTEFPQRANAAVREIQLQDKLTCELYDWQQNRSPTVCIEQRDMKEYLIFLLFLPFLYVCITLDISYFLCSSSSFLVAGCSVPSSPPPLLTFLSLLQIGDFTLHDGPPYANGRLHMGHALNKVLKDIINRYKMLRGFRVHYKPGWDCHGLPIEMKVLETMTNRMTENIPEKQANNTRESHVSTDDVRASMSVPELRAHARSFAEEAIIDQRESFLRWGVMGEWNHPYVTMQPKYEAEQIRVFWHMVQHGLISRGHKPVYWSPSSRTALAEAELEYRDDHRSNSIYVGFHVTSMSNALLQHLQSSITTDTHVNLDSVYAAIWTTTPWTIPANVATSYNPEFEYCLVQFSGAKHAGRSHIVAHSRVEDIENELSTDDAPCTATVFSTFSGSLLSGSSYTHPLYPAQTGAFLPGDHVTLETGTGLVHTAPAHGLEDFDVCKKFEQPMVSIVDESGCYTDDVALEELAGKFILTDGNKMVMEMLEAKHAMLHKSAITHRYPYDWRTKQPVIFRATKQWFARLDSIRQNALSALEDVQMIPETGRARLSAMIAGRSEWCISRQRHWGVPIPVFYHCETHEPLLTEQTIQHVADLFAKHGSDCWWTLAERELLPDDIDASMYYRGQDTLDVWFDSGVSWSAVLPPEQRPSDVVLEGSDQHRGWFQSSLLTSVAVKQQAPYRAIITHGFILDRNGHKMSKSLGNVVEPDDIIAGITPQQRKARKQAQKKKGMPKGKQTDALSGVAYGADVMRLWIGGADYSRDVMLGGSVVEKSSQSLRRLRNTCRYTLGCLADFDPALHHVQYDSLPLIDKYMLHRTAAFVESVTTAYDQYRFSHVVAELSTFVSNDLSSFYFEISKDRLYVDAPDSPRRRACQTVMLEILKTLSKTCAPILCYTMEDMYQHVPAAARSSFFEYSEEPTAQQTATRNSSTIFASGWPKLPGSWSNQQVNDTVVSLKQIRGIAYRAVELARAEKHLSTALEAQIVINIETTTNRDNHLGAAAYMADLLRSVQEEPVTLSDMLICSQARVVSKSELAELNNVFIVRDKVDTPHGAIECAVAVLRADVGDKCPRCWMIRELTHVSGLCQRCDSAETA